MDDQKGTIDVEALARGMNKGGVERRVSRGYLESQVLHLQRENDGLRREIADLKGLSDAADD